MIHITITPLLCDRAHLSWRSDVATAIVGWGGGRDFIVTNCVPLGEENWCRQ